MFEKLTANQRLILAVAVSFVFFIGYSYLVPHKKINSNKQTILTHIVNDVSSKSTNIKQAIVTNKVTASKTDTLVTINSKRYQLKIDTLGRISSMVLLADKYLSKKHKAAQLIEKNGAKPLFILFNNAKLNEEASKVPYEATTHVLNISQTHGSVTVVQKLSSVTVTKKITFFNDGHYDVDISLSKPVKYSIGFGQRPDVEAKMMTVAGAMVYYGKGKNTIFKDGDVKEKKVFKNVHFISSFDQYFADIIYGFNKKLDITVEFDNKYNPLLTLTGMQNMHFNGYIGPKTYKTLKRLDPVLVNGIEYGWFTFAARPLFLVLAWLESIFGNWGWAIIALTFLVRLVLYPLTYKGMVSMQKMKLVAPKIKALQAKHKGDAQRVNAAVMQEYKKHGVNPLGGCLPMVLQIPVFFAMYRVFLNTPELQGAPWILWVHNLGQMDHLYILPILMGLTMFFQQHITPNNFTDKLQAKVFKYLPVIFTFFFITFPAGLVLYWLTNNLASIAQQYAVNRKFSTLKKEAPSEDIKVKNLEKKDD